MKSILISEQLHERLKEISLKTGIKIKNITEKALLKYIEENKK
jgi:hypothetical protein